MAERDDDPTRPLRPPLPRRPSAPTATSTSQVLAALWPNAREAFDTAQREFVTEAVEAIARVLRDNGAHVIPSELAGHVVQMVAGRCGLITRAKVVNATMTHHHECGTTPCKHCGKRPNEPVALPSLADAPCRRCGLVPGQAP